MTIMPPTTTSSVHSRRGSPAGFSIIELLISMAIIVTIMGVTMTAMMQAARANETAVLVTAMNNNLRTGMDLMIRDMLQVGSGLPPGHYVLMPSGVGSAQIRMPGPPGATILSVVGDTELNAVNPGSNAGPTVAGIVTDTITVLAADSTFNDVPLTARAADGTSITVSTVTTTGQPIVLNSGPDRVVAGQLLMIEKGSYAILVQVTSINNTTRQVFFATGDSLNLNQHTATDGVMGKPCAGGGCAVAPLPTGLTAVAPSPDIALPSPQTVPPTPYLNTTATRVRMITYYIDNTDTAHPKLVRRINNGHPTVYNNNSGTTVAFDIDKLKIDYDLADGNTNPSNVRFVAADYLTTGACTPAACTVNQIRKVNVTLAARSRKPFSGTNRYFHNVLTTQVSLRSMSFVNEYSAP